MPDISIWRLPTQSNNQRLEPVHLIPPPASLNASSQALPDGVYTTFRTFEGDKILPFQDHLQRLTESARLLGFSIVLPAAPLLSATGQVVRRESWTDARVRLTIDLEDDPGTAYLALEPLEIPALDEYSQGVSAVTLPFRRENPRAKKTEFIATAEAARHTLPPGVNEGLMLDTKNRILEGLSSNFFAVWQNMLWTADEGVLPGIIRSKILEAAGELGLPVHFDAVPVSVLPELQEAFLTSSSRSVLPVRQIDAIRIGIGLPGPVTQTLAEAYWRRVQTSLERLPK